MEIVAEMPGDSHRGLPRRRPRRDHHGLGRLRALRRSARDPGRRRGFRAARHSCGARPARSSSCCEGRAAVENMYPRCVTREGNGPAQEKLWKVFRPTGGQWRGIAHVPNGNLRLRDEFAHVDARRRFEIDLASLLGGCAVATRASVHLRRHHGGRSPRPNAARSSARSACPTRRSARAWSRARGRAESGTSTAALDRRLIGRPGRSRRRGRGAEPT